VNSHTSIPTGYHYSGCPRGYETNTCIILIQRDEDKYHIICTYEYTLTSLIRSILELSLSSGNLLVVNLSKEVSCKSVWALRSLFEESLSNCNPVRL